MSIQHEFTKKLRAAKGEVQRWGDYLLRADEVWQAVEEARRGIAAELLEKCDGAIIGPTVKRLVSEQPSIDVKDQGIIFTWALFLYGLSDEQKRDAYFEVAKFMGQEPEAALCSGKGPVSWAGGSSVVLRLTREAAPGVKAEVRLYADVPDEVLEGLRRKGYLKAHASSYEALECKV